MTHYRKTKLSFLEAGLPCASLSAECQRDNNARQRPPQNRLHIWWARRPPTISRAALLGALLPFDLQFDSSVLPDRVSEPTEDDLDKLSARLRPHVDFFRKLLEEVGSTQLTDEHDDFMRALGITGDPCRAYRRMAERENYLIGHIPILLPMSWTYRHPPALSQTPTSALIQAIMTKSRGMLGLADDEPVTILDFMAGGGSIPLEGVRYGAKVYANDLNPIASLVLKSTIEYPARFGTSLINRIEHYANQIDIRVRERLLPLFYTEPPEIWWEHEKDNIAIQYRSASIVRREPANLDSSKNCSLWMRIVPCSRCNLNIPISTNFHIVTKKGKPEASIAAFAEVPGRDQGNDCTFRIVKQAEWKDCRWPKPDFTHWHPRETPTFKDGKAICPRCAHVMSGEEVKALAQAQEGGLAAQLYAVCSQVPVKLTYRNGDEKIRYLWRFRAPTQDDLSAIQSAQVELDRLLPRWDALGLVPTEEIPEGEKTKEPRNMGLMHWRDLFLPRQLLTNLTVLEEIRSAQARVRQELPAEEAEAVNVYLAFILSKVVNYNSVNTFWDYTRKKGAQTFSRHDFAFRSAFTEFEGARETIMWGASQVIGAYEGLASLIHGGSVSLSADDDEDISEADVEATETDQAEEDNGESTVIRNASELSRHSGMDRRNPDYRPVLSGAEGEVEPAGLSDGSNAYLSESLPSMDAGFRLENPPYPPLKKGGRGDFPPCRNDDRDLKATPLTVTLRTHQNIPLRPEIIVPTITHEDAAALSIPEPGTVHLICVDPPYYNNIQYSELSNFFYVWLKRALTDEPGLEHLFREPLAESNREAVANAARWAREASVEKEAWQRRYDGEFERLRDLKVKATEAKRQALEAAGPKPGTAKERADRFYEDKMAQVFRRAKLLLHPAGRMVVMFNHKQTYAWRALGMALIRAGFDIRSSVPIHTEAESSLNIRGLDAARSTVLLLCMPREDKEQVSGNWAAVQSQVARKARNAAAHFQQQGLAGTDLYLSSLGPAIGVVGEHWPVTDLAGREIDLEDALNESYRAVGQWRLEQLLEALTTDLRSAEFSEAAAGFSAESADRNSQALWLWLDAFDGELADSDEVRKLAKSLNTNPDDFRRMGLLEFSKDMFILHPPAEVNLRLLAKRLSSAENLAGRAAREADVWEERQFPGFQAAAVWNAIALMGGSEDIGARGPEALKRWLNASGYGNQREFMGAFVVTLALLEKVFSRRTTGSWQEAKTQARRAWDLVLKNWQI